MSEKTKKKRKIRKPRRCYSGIGGQAVLEGIMMKNKDQYAVAVRRSDGSIAVDVESCEDFLAGNKIAGLPFIRGVINFVNSLRLGLKSLNFSADMYADEGEEPAKSDNVTTTLTGIIAVALAVGLFMILPVYITKWITSDIRNESLIAIIEGVIRLGIFLIYVVAISAMKDIRRVYMYHGAEHKCINCIERGKPLTVKNVMRSSRMHKRCGTSFMLFVVVVSIIVFFFIRVDNMALKIVLRLALVPVIAGISYELLRLAGRYDNVITLILSGPGLLLQRLTTREPDEEMAEVAIRAVEAVFDWRRFLSEEFGRETDDSQEPA
ncbi:MAG: DUF1385 domain-containing protein [Lachnospiraceae bacterium]|nr:DUF1385 domain-containing protein [Lachnospiraceae bacterium]